MLKIALNWNFKLLFTLEMTLYTNLSKFQDFNNMGLHISQKFMTASE